MSWSLNCWAMAIWKMIVMKNRVPMIHVGHAIVDMTLTHLSTISAVATALKLVICLFERKKCHVLKVCNDSGKHERKFAITSQSDRHKMKKFLEFLAD